MTERTKVTIYKGRNSPFLTAPITNAAGQVYGATQTTAITGFRLRYNGSYIDSTTLASAFDKSTYSSRGQIKIDIGPSEPTTGSDTAAEFLIFEATATAGRTVEVFSITVSGDVYGAGTVAASL